MASKSTGEYAVAATRFTADGTSDKWFKNNSMQTYEGFSTYDFTRGATCSSCIWLGVPLQEGKTSSHTVALTAKQCNASGAAIYAGTAVQNSDICCCYDLEFESRRIGKRMMRWVIGVTDAGGDQFGNRCFQEQDKKTNEVHILRRRLLHAARTEQRQLNSSVRKSLVADQALEIQGGVLLLLCEAQ